MYPRYFLGLISAVLMTIEYIVGVQINSVNIPQAVRNNTGRPVVLDCDYTVKEDDTGLVIKWFLNGAPAAVYQWIPPKRPQGLGPLKDRLDLNFKISDDPYRMHRALRILNPTTDIAGEYKCFVSTFNDEDFSVRHMTVYVPEQELLMRQTAPAGGVVNVSCRAIAVYPQPQISIYNDTDRKSRKSIPDTEVTSRLRNDGRYDVTVTATVFEADLSPSTVFDCEMTIPNTGYKREIRQVYFPEGIEFNGSASRFRNTFVVGGSFVILNYLLRITNFICY